MDKLKTRGVLLAYKNVSIAEGIVYNKGTLLVCLFVFIFAISKYNTNKTKYIIGKEAQRNQ